MPSRRDPVIPGRTDFSNQAVGAEQAQVPGHTIGGAALVDRVAGRIGIEDGAEVGVPEALEEPHALRDGPQQGQFLRTDRAQRAMATPSWITGTQTGSRR